MYNSWQVYIIIYTAAHTPSRVIYPSGGQLLQRLLYIWVHVYSNILSFIIVSSRAYIYLQSTVYIVWVYKIWCCRHRRFSTAFAQKPERPHTPCGVVCFYAATIVEMKLGLALFGKSIIQCEYNIYIAGDHFFGIFFCSKEKRPRKGRLYNLYLCMCVITRLYMAAVASGICGVLDDPQQPRRQRRKINSFSLTGKNTTTRCSNYYSNYMGSNNIPTLPKFIFSCRRSRTNPLLFRRLSLSLSLSLMYIYIHFTMQHAFIIYNSYIFF